MVLGAYVAVWPPSESIECFERSSQCFFGCIEAMRCSGPESVLVYGARCTCAPYGVAPEYWFDSMNQAEDQLPSGFFDLLFEVWNFFEKVAFYDTYSAVPEP